MNADPTQPEPQSSEPTRPETGEETTTRIPLIPPPPAGDLADPAPDASNDSGVDASSASSAGAPLPPDARPAAREATAGQRDTRHHETSPRTMGERTTSERSPGEHRPSPRTGPIVWGALILVFCGYISQQVFGSDGLDTAGWITATVIGLGVLLLGVGFAVLIRSRRETQRRR